MFHATVVGTGMYFGADDGSRRRMLWRTDGTTTGTTMAAAIKVSGRLHTGGTSLVKDIFPSLGSELWRTDGTSAGTVLVSDLRPGSAGSHPRHLVPAGRGVYFSALGPDHDEELWASGGTAAGTDMVCDIHPGPATAGVSRLTVSGERVFLVATDGLNGFELHAVKGAAVVEALGHGCGPDTPRLMATNPVIGEPFTYSGTRAPQLGGRILIVGASAATPRNLPPITRAGCTVWLDVSAPFVIRLHPQGRSWQLSLSIPNHAALLGVTLVTQGVYEPSPLFLSNGLLLTVGGG